MKVRPGRNTIGVAAALVVVGLASFLAPPLAWAVPIAAAAVAVVGWFEWREARRTAEALTVNRRMPNVIGRAVAFQVELTVGNPGSRAVDVEVRDVAPENALPRLDVSRLRVDAGGSARVATRYRIPVRGRHVFGPVWVRIPSRLGLLDVQREVDCTGSVAVLPETFASKERLAEDVRAARELLDRLVRSRDRGEGTEFESLAEFREGDDPRRIDWRATARMRRPVVRRFQIERHRDVMIVVDCGRLMGADTGRGTKLDRAVDAALMLARVALESGDRCGIALFDDRVRGYLPPQGGAGSLRWLSEGVYGVQSELRESDFGRVFAELQYRQGKRTLIVVVSDVADAETSRQMRAALATLAKRHVVLFAALQTPLLRRILREPTESLLDGSRKAVALGVLTERERAIHALDRSGVHVADVEPEQLTVALVNQFVELRSRNLL